MIADKIIEKTLNVKYKQEGIKKKTIRKYAIDSNLWKKNILEKEEKVFTLFS